ncbi:YdaU family protein, partial [Bartonella rochalimae]|uniref:YdaU family protein n=1 Tax=Bartonella rochalimae TaxID=395923 RepID=UPI003F685CCD
MKQVLHSEAPHYESSILPYVCWYQNDFLGGVRGMRAHEIGIYTILLNEMYARGRPLNLSIERLARLCGCDKRTFESVLEMLITEGKILQLASGLWNTRCEIVFHERAKLLEQKSSAGRSSAKKRKKINEQFQHLLNASPLDVERNSEAQKTEEKETPTGVSQKKPSAVVSSASFCDSPSPQKDIKGCQLSPDQKTEEKESPNGVSQKKPSAVVSSASFCDSLSPKKDIKGCQLSPDQKTEEKESPNGVSQKKPSAV